MSKPLFYQCQVLDNEDPLMLGRVRARLLVDNYADIIKSITDPIWNEEKDIWTARDPFIFNPLLPYFIYQTPKVDELIQILYVNPEFKYLNQYYVQNTFSSPTTTFKEYYIGANKFTGTGGQLSNPLPLKNQDGTFKNNIMKGVFPEPGDNAILGRGSADLIVKQNEVLLRAGKIKGTLQPNVLPAGNIQRGYLQISNFENVKVPKEPKKITILNELVVSVKYLIEWVITNPENTLDKFSGYIYLYQLKPDLSTNSENLTIGSNLSENLKKLVASQGFNALSIQETISYINDFIKTCNTSTTTKNGITLFSDNNNKFPIFYRPNNLTYSYLNPSSSSNNSGNNGIIVKNITSIYNGIKLNPALKQGGYGLIYEKNNVGKPMNTETKIVPQSEYINTPTTYSTLGGDKLFLLSNTSSIPGKGKINFENTLYGITNDTFSDEVIPKTSSMVRGEELLELINLITRFLVTHTHAYPGLPPVPVTQDGTTTSQILTELQNAVNKILNENIRIN
jgi:hypothetical protein